jgi:carbamoyltransferase
VYEAASRYCLRGTSDLGKLMGLAPYGREGIFKERIFELRDGRLFVDDDWMRGFDRPARTAEDFKQDFQYYADIAFWVQREVERALLYLVQARYEMCPTSDLAYAGGVALNAVANARILRQSKFRRIYMVPAAGDNGIALGCAFYGWLEVLGRERVPHSGSTCFGRGYGSPEVAAALRSAGEDFSWRHDSDPAGAAAQLLAEGKVIAWFQGGSEFGPRALGRRSILADPRKPGVVDLINVRVKRREEFRPFAPSVLLEDAPTYFEGDFESPYMILVAQVREPWRETLRSVVHRDGSARIQTVTPDWNPRYYDLLKACKRLTGLPILLNTSFNRKGMPIVETPEEAINFFREADGLDALVMEDFILEHKAEQKAEHKAPADLWNPSEERQIAGSRN